MAEDDDAGKPMVYFSTCKREALTPSQGLRQLHRKLKARCRVDTNKEGITLDVLQRGALHIFAGPREKFDDIERGDISKYLRGGGSVLFLLTEGGDARLGCQLNSLFARWGIEANADSVIRSVFFKYYHPKEVCITNGVVNREINRAAGKSLPSAGSSGGGGQAAALDASAAAGLGELLPPPPRAAAATSAQQQVANSSLTFVYPYGCTLSVQSPAIPLLSSGCIAYPLQRPIAAAYEDPSGGGRAVVLGSMHLVSDEWLMREENSTLVDVLVDWLLRAPKLKLNQIDAEHPEIVDAHSLPDTAALAERVRVSLEEVEELPRDFTAMFDTALFSFDITLVPEAVALFRALDVKHEPLTLIHPQFDQPLPAFLPAVFPPAHPEPPVPALDLFDLDELFASEKAQLAALTNKCKPEDVEYYVCEAGEALGITRMLKQDNRGDAKAVLEYVFRQVVRFKMLNQDVARGGAAHLPAPSGEAISFWDGGSPA